MGRKVEDGTLSLEWADVRRVSEMARSTTVIVMQRNIAKGTRWRKHSVSEHLASARVHISYPYPGAETYEEDIEDALCRLAMALAKLEEEELGLSKTR